MICDNDIIVNSNFYKLLNTFINEQNNDLAGSIFYTNSNNLYNLNNFLEKFKILNNSEINDLLFNKPLNIKYNKTNFIINDKFVIYYRFEPQLILMNYENIQKIPNFLSCFTAIKWGVKLYNHYITYDTFAKFTKIILENNINFYNIPNIYNYIKHFSGASFSNTLTEMEYIKIMNCRLK
jgi:hypothetical protein